MGHGSDTRMVTYHLVKGNQLSKEEKLDENKIRVWFCFSATSHENCIQYKDWCLSNMLKSSRWTKDATCFASKLLVVVICQGQWNSRTMMGVKSLIIVRNTTRLGVQDPSYIARSKLKQELGKSQTHIHANRRTLASYMQAWMANVKQNTHAHGNQHSWNNVNQQAERQSNITDNSMIAYLVKMMMVLIYNRYMPLPLVHGILRLHTHARTHTLR